MKLLQPPALDAPSPCPYLPGEVRRFEYFLASGVSARQLSRLLAAGWRKFGLYFFRPRCPACSRCIPLRVEVERFAPSRHQRRVLRKGTGLEVRFGPLRFFERHFEIFRRHSRRRFGQDGSLEEFVANFLVPSCPALQAEVLLGPEVVGVGYLDRGEDCLSSVYFCFDPEFSQLHPGTFSILQEIAHAASLGLRHYYLGYFVPGCAAMAYKDHFRPRQHFDWASRRWRTADETADPP